MEVTTRWGLPLASFVWNNEGFQLQLDHEKKWIESLDSSSASSIEGLSQLTKVEIDPSLIADIFFADRPNEKNWNCEHGVDFNAASASVAASPSLEQSDSLACLMKRSNPHRDAGGETKLVWVTSGMQRRVQAKTEFAKLILTVQQSEEQPKVQDAIFQLAPPPEGYQIINLNRI